MARSSGDPFCTGLVLIALFVSGLLTVYGGLKKYLFLQKIKDTPTSKAESVALGLTELYGAAKCAEDVVSPISKAKCVYWRVLGEYYKSGKGGGWRTIYDYSFRPKFFVEDETGKVLVDLDQAQVEIPVNATCDGYISGHGIFGMAHTPMPESVLNFVNGLGEQEKGAFMSHADQEVRISEYYLAEGDQVYVLGTAEAREGAQSAVHSETLIIRKSTADGVLYISDSPERKITSDLRNSLLWDLAKGLGISAICLLLILIMVNL